MSQSKVVGHDFGAIRCIHYDPASRYASPEPAAHGDTNCPGCGTKQESRPGAGHELMTFVWMKVALPGSGIVIGFFPAVNK